MFLTVNGTRLNIDIEGEGFPCLALGQCGKEQIARAISPNLRNHLQLIFVDLRGSGLSDDGDVASATLETICADVDAVRQALGHEQIAVLGHSAGGFFALEYARRYPDHCAYAILDGCPPNMSETMRRTAAQYWEENASAERKALQEQRQSMHTKEQLEAMDAGQRLIATYHMNSPRYFYDPQYDSTHLWGTMQMGLFTHFWGTVFPKHDPVPQFPQITPPVFVAAGRYDFVCPPVLWDDDIKLLPQGTLAVFDRAGHWPMLEEQAEFDRRLLDWMAQHPVNSRR